MKRKFKLFATVASLCLSVALMAFGVYAAASVSYTVSGSVSFAAQVACTWTAQARYQDGTTPSGATDDEYVLTGTESAGASDSWAADGLQFTTAEDQDTIIYTIKCTNNGNQAITIGLASTPTLFTNALLDVTYNDGEALESTELTTSYSSTLAADQTWTLTITVHLNDLTQTLSGEGTSFSLALTATAA